MMKNCPDKPTSSEPPRRLSARTGLLAAVLLASCLAVGYLVLFADRGSDGNAEAAISALQLEDIPFDGTRAYGYLRQLCALGRRPSGSPGMRAQQRLLADHFQKLGGQVEFQKFRVRHPLDASAVEMANLIVRWHPERKQRILLCAHYDTLPYPMLDPVDRNGLFVGANDGASGVALLMELAHDMPELQRTYGVDFVFFDGEEFIFRQDHRYFLGSEYFARSLVKQRPEYRYRWGVLLDMIGDADLQIYMERHGMSWSDTRPLVEEIWATAHRLGVREFIARGRYTIRDDHLPLHNIAGIPCCDLIDFDYPAWHTRNDTPEQCSALSLAKVGWVVREWLRAVP
ncbi:MAG TPA: M28 family peptidase [Thermoguttaceae bacterium]|nr:M28 family peptidase [Thermoguttaceae bacterium]